MSRENGGDIKRRCDSVVCGPFTRPCHDVCDVRDYALAARRIRGMGSEGAIVCGEVIAAPDRDSNAVDIRDACVSSADTDNAAVTLTPPVTPSRGARVRGHTDKPKSDIKK